MLVRTLMATAAAAWLATADANLLRGPLADIGVTDRVTGEQLPVYWHRGERWIAGKPGHRYSITLASRHHGRLLAVLSVDGVNAVSGETAAWDQNGYVFGPGERAEIRGWRKSQERIAAFEFTALADSYAARTGRPDHVGVIGVALFREAVPVSPPMSPAPGAVNKAPSEAQAVRADGQRAEADAAASSRLGTGHGRSETSIVGLTHFQRAQASPDQLITIRYDSRENLIAMGVIAAPPSPRPNPFPVSAGFVADPPPR